MRTVVSPIARIGQALALVVLLVLAPLACERDDAAEDSAPPTDTEAAPAEEGDEPATPDPADAEEQDPDQALARADDEPADADLVETPQGAVFALHAMERTGEPPAQLSTDPRYEGLDPVLDDGEEYLKVEITLVEVGSGHLKPCDDACARLLPEQAGDEPVLSSTSGIELQDPGDFARSGYELIDGAHMVLVFEVPDDASPDAVRLFLEHFERWSPEGEPDGVEGLSVDIPLA